METAEINHLPQSFVLFMFQTLLEQLHLFHCKHMATMQAKALNRYYTFCHEQHLSFNQAQLKSVYF